MKRLVRARSLAWWFALWLTGVCSLATSTRAAETHNAKGTFNTSDVFNFMQEELTVTTASKLRTKLSEVPQAVYVITGEEVRRLAPTTIADLLRYVPGGNVTTPTASQWSVSLHLQMLTVINAYYLIMIDGRPIYSISGPFMLWWPIPVEPEDIERVEVVLGPSGTVNGPQAVFGVVNFLTKQPTTPGVSLTTEGGASLGDDRVFRPGNVHAHLSATGSLDNWHMRAAVGYDRLVPWDSASIVVDGRLVPTRPGERGLLNAVATWDLGKKASLTLAAGGSSSQSSFVSLSPGWLVGDEEYADARLVLHSTLRAGDRLELRTWARRQRLDYTVSLNPALPSIPFNPDELTYAATATYSTHLPFRNRLVTGASFGGGYSRWVGLPHGRWLQEHAGIFIEDEYRPWEPLIFTAGVRLDTPGTSETSLAHRLYLLPRASVVWLPFKGQTLRLSYSEGLLYPSALVEGGELSLYQGRLPVYTTDRKIYATDHGRAIEVGYRGQLGRFLLVTASYTYYFISGVKWLYPVGNAALPVHVQMLSGGERRQMVDLTASFRPAARVRCDVVASFDFGYKRPPALASRTSVPPLWHFSATLHVNLSSRLRVDLMSYAMAPHEANDFVTGARTAIAGWLYVNVQLSYTLWPAHGLEVFAVGTNLTNTTFGPGITRELPDSGVSSVGRRFMLGLRTRL